MTVFNRIEYQTVYFAALLHDIGKFLQRVKVIKKSIPKTPHENLGADFVTGTGFFNETGMLFNLRGFSTKIDRSWIDIDKLKTSIEKHHSGNGYWGAMVHKSDSYSTKERFEEGEGVTTYPPNSSGLIPLKSIYSAINLTNKQKDGLFCYKPDALDTFNAFPIQNLKSLSEDDSNNVFSDFIEELNTIDMTNPSFDMFFNTVHSILEKHLWCLPCHTHPDIADISIFDHLKTSSAIAACLYHYHHAHQRWLVKDVKDDTLPKFILVGGDISGIQKYLYNISTITGEGGVAKRLRARSFYITALVEVIITRLLQELDLPISCVLQSAGGKFILLAPNTEKSKKILDNEYNDISRWLFNRFSGEISLMMDWSVTLQGQDFCRKTDFTILETHGEDEETLEEKDSEEHRECNFRDRIDEVWLAIEKQKNEKFKSVLQAEGVWNETEFVRKSLYDSYLHGKTDCRSCRKFPADYPDPHDTSNSEDVFCEKCLEDKIIGRKLIDAEFFAIGKRKPDQSGQIAKTNNQRNTITFFNDSYFIKILDTYTSQDWKDDYIVVQKLRDRKNRKEPIPAGCVYRFIANYTPFFTNFSKENDLCDQCKEGKPCEQNERMARESDEKHLMTFSCIAAHSSTAIDTEIEDGREFRGVQKIGVLKADVDNLGLIFSEGLGNRITPSRYLTLSRMTELFFSGWMYRILQSEFRHTYTVYSGGDDLVVIGPWEEIIFFAEKLNREFRRFTCGNGDVTLSAGIAVVDPKYPVSEAVALADQNLESSKASGKDRITLFDTTVKWTVLPDIICEMEKLDMGHCMFPKILTAQFLHRLLHYRQMHWDVKMKGEVRKLIYHSHLNYDVRRNLKERLDNMERNSQKENTDISWFRSNILGQMMEINKFKANHRMDWFNIPVNWTLYRNRKIGKGGNKDE
ncbi:MAG: type III-A CRISPR-associated protein Cas10/Csm1 [Desulfobacteraceae bacterium]|jgi:CRISPR-associated protein Csm1